MKKFGVFDVVLAVLVVIGIAANIYVYGFFIKAGKGGEPESSGVRAASSEPPSAAADSPAQGGGARADATAGQSGGAASPASPEQESAASATESSPDTAQASSPGAAVDTPQPATGDSQSPASYAPSGAPTAADFAWYMDGAARTAGLPQGASRITDMSDIMGDWKLLIWIDPDHLVEYESAFILATAAIDEIGGSVSMLVHSLLMVDEDGSVQDLSRFDAELFTGGYLQDGGGISVGESRNRFIIADFYTKDGAQYGIGVNEVQSGEPCYVALVRP